MAKNALSDRELLLAILFLGSIVIVVVVAAYAVFTRWAGKDINLRDRFLTEFDVEDEKAEP